MRAGGWAVLASYLVLPICSTGWILPQGAFVKPAIRHQGLREAGTVERLAGRRMAWGMPQLGRKTARGGMGLKATTMAPPAATGMGSEGKQPVVTNVRFLESEKEEDELTVCCPETRRVMDCTVDMYATLDGVNYCVALPIFSPVAICYHKGDRMIPVDNDSELMDRLFDFLAPTMEQEDLYLVRSPVCLTLDGDLGDLGDGEFDEDELEGWEEYDSDDETNLWDSDDEDDEDDPDAGPVDMEIEKLTNPKYWDDEDAEDVEDAYGDDWEKVAAFQYDNVEYSMVKILEPVLILAKEDPTFQGITKWVLPSEAEAEVVGPIMEGLIKTKLGIEDDEDEEEED